MTGSAPHRAAAALLGLLLLTGATACTGGSGGAERRTDDPSASPSASRPAASAVLRPEVTHVAGTLTPRRRHGVSTAVRRLLERFADAAFLAGDYPRSDFGDAFTTFTSGSVRAARRDQDLLTNRTLGSSTTSVRAVRRTAYLSVLAPQGRVSGATAAVDWTFRVDRGDRPARQVHLKGRLLLTREQTGRWAIFGYDVNRSATPARGDS